MIEIASKENPTAIQKFKYVAEANGEYISIEEHSSVSEIWAKRHLINRLVAMKEEIDEWLSTNSGLIATVVMETNNADK